MHSPTAAFGENSYATRSNSYDSPSTARARGHTFSSSLSSDAEFRETKPATTTHSQVAPPRIARRDSTKYHKNLQKLPSIFGEDEDSVRVKVYDAQRAEHPAVRTRPRKNTRPGGKSSTGSASSSIDLGHLAAFQGRLGPAGNRRSRSFDFGSHHRPNRDLMSPNPLDVAPTPVIFNGPEAQSSPTKAAFSTTPVARRNSTRSSKSQHTRKPRAGTLGTAAVKNKPGDVPPPMPTPKQSGQSHPVGEGRPSTTSPHDASFPYSRPGFFRRVFGSSKTVSAQNDPPPLPSGGSARPSQDHPVRDINSPNTPSAKLHKPARTSSDIAANKENHPVITKKTSSFFRRRKKSVSNNAPPPLPLTLNSERFNGQPGEPSPGEQSPCIHGSIILAVILCLPPAVRATRGKIRIKASTRQLQRRPQQAPRGISLPGHAKMIMGGAGLKQARERHSNLSQFHRYEYPTMILSLQTAAARKKHLGDHLVKQALYLSLTRTSPDFDSQTTVCNHHPRRHL